MIAPIFETRAKTHWFPGLHVVRQKYNVTNIGSFEFMLPTFPKLVEKVLLSTAEYVGAFESTWEFVDDLLSE